jgi:hypothetical protein
LIDLALQAILSDQEFCLRLFSRPMITRLSECSANQPRISVSDGASTARLASKERNDTRSRIDGGLELRKEKEA